MLKRKIMYDGLPDSMFYSNKRICDVISESILPSPYLLVDDIIDKLKNGMNFFEYSKNDIEMFSDRHWKFYNDLNNIHKEFTLTIIRCSGYELIKRYEWLSVPTSIMMEFGDPEDSNREFIWIRDVETTYDDGFKNLLLHELGHVWTFSFGFSNDDFKIGQGPSNAYERIDSLKLTDYQKDVCISFYNGNINVLKEDFKYVLCKADSTDSANYEIPVHIDNIIEVLVDDYLNFNSDVSTEAYLNRMFRLLENDPNFTIDDFSIYKIFTGVFTLKNHSTIESVKNPIRRMFLIFAFGTNEQKEYFKNACEEEFGKLDK
jgi:hypothetical protein